MSRDVAKRAAVLALQLVLIVVTVLVAAELAPRWTIVPLPHLKNAPLTGADLAQVLSVFVGWHVVAYVAALALFRVHAFTSARRALAELYVLMAATSLASCHLFLLTVVPFSANFHAFVYAIGPLLHGAVFLSFATQRPGVTARLRERARAVPARVKDLALSRWTAVTCAVVLSPGVLAVLYKKNGDFANAVNAVRVALNHDDDAGFTLVEAFPGLVLDQPMDARFSPADPQQLFVLERPGRLVKVDLSRGVEREVLLDLTDEVLTTLEMGALSFALHPEFGRAGSPNRAFAYVYYTASPAADVQRNRLARFDLSGPDLGARLASRLTLVDQGRPANGFHNGGSVHFGEDGFLYWSCGDFASRRSQAIDDALGGGVFRIDVDRRGGDVSGPILRQPKDGVTDHYFIPKDNPWAGRPDALGELVVIGCRNPFRFSLDGATLWIGDVGYDAHEEITRVERGGNAQWPFLEASAPTRYGRPEQVIGVETPPFYSYAQTAVDRAVIGGLVYRGERYAALRGRYVYADNNSGLVRALDVTPGSRPEVLTRAPFLGQQGITSLVLAPDGSLLVTALGSRDRPSGALLRLVRSDEAPVTATPAAFEVASSTAAGKFEMVCSRCHGLDGKGERQQDAQDGLAQRPDFTDPAWQAKVSDADIRKIVLEGGAAIGKSRDMPSFRGFLDEEELRQMVEHIRGFAGGGAGAK